VGHDPTTRGVKALCSSAELPDHGDSARIRTEDTKVKGLLL
jgi:hypothetical protein